MHIYGKVQTGAGGTTNKTYGYDRNFNRTANNLLTATYNVADRITALSGFQTPQYNGAGAINRKVLSTTPTAGTASNWTPNPGWFISGTATTSLRLGASCSGTPLGMRAARTCMPFVAVTRLTGWTRRVCYLMAIG